TIYQVTNLMKGVVTHGTGQMAKQLHRSSNSSNSSNSSSSSSRRVATARRSARTSGGSPQRSYEERSGGWRWLRILFYLMLLGIIGGAGVGLAAYFHFSKGLPPLYGLSDYRPSLVTRVYARDYQLLGEFFFQRRQFIRMSDVPRQLINAILAIEDAKFYQHPGIDLHGIMRAALANVRAGRAVQGASTITQQVAKTFLLSSVKSLDRKIKEIILALRIEREFSKDEIMELYINQIYLGAGAYGVGAAARIYFDKDVSELTLAQMALMAGLPKAPNHYSPWRHPDNAQKRQKLVLNRMVEVGFISQAEADAAAAEPLGLARPQEPLDTIAPHYLEHVRRIILGDWGEGQLYKGGLDVYTPLDPTLQRHAQEAVRQGLIEYDRRHGYRGPLDHLEKVQDASVRQAWLRSKSVNEFSSVSDYQLGLVLAVDNRKAKVLLSDESTVELPLEGVSWARKRLDEKKKPGKIAGPPPKTVAEVLRVGDVILLEAPNEKHKIYHLAQEPEAEAALVSLDPHTGQVLAMVGGYNYEKSEFNRATQGQRQPGSSFKPFIYAAALDKELSPTDLIDDSPMPLAYRDPVTKELKVWRAQNYEHKFYGPTTVRVGLVHSRNLVTIRILKRVGMSAAIPYLKKFGFEIPENRHDLSLALGTMGFTPLKMASAYAVFANGGKLVEPVVISRVQDRFGRTVFRHRGGDCLLCHQEIDRTSVLAPELTAHLEQRDQGVFDRPALDPATIYQVTNLMKGVVTHGTGQMAKQLQRPVAGKTGTTNNLRDAWFVGFSPSLVASVWVGMDDNSTLGQKETGGRAALPIWVKYMAKALQNVPVTDFVVPKGIVLEEIDPETGFPAVEGSGNRVMESFKPGQGPLQSSAVPVGVVPGEGIVPGAPGAAPAVGDGFY
uniref:penicillin-binding protein 1A n=1 Tax=Candidatus Magnetaquicoccus inordinatus TaxID=2496818 RepID=UPI00102B7390